VKEPIMQCTPAILAAIALAGAATTGAACRLNPLVDDTPGASTTIQPADATIKHVSDNTDLTTQITLNDSLDSKALAANGSLIARGNGFSGNGTPVPYWSFGAVNRAPAPMYVFGTGDPTTTAFVTNSHLPLVDAVPGDVKYSPIHNLYRVVLTDKYHDEKITSTEALADALELGLIQEPVAIKAIVDMPLVRPGTKLDVGAGGPALPGAVYAHGYIVDAYRLGGQFAVQPNPNGLVPTNQVSFLRAQGEAGYLQTRPIFQANVPSAPPTTAPNYTPLSVVVNVDLAPNVAANSITSDAQLFTRGTNGAITGTKPEVLQFTVTTTQLDLQMQFSEGAP
jgi:hypothetical protein